MKLETRLLAVKDRLFGSPTWGRDQYTDIRTAKGLVRKDKLFDLEYFLTTSEFTTKEFVGFIDVMIQLQGGNSHLRYHEGYLLENLKSEIVQESGDIAFSLQKKNGEGITGEIKVRTRSQMEELHANEPLLMAIYTADCYGGRLQPGIFTDKVAGARPHTMLTDEEIRGGTPYVIHSPESTFWREDGTSLTVDYDSYRMHLPMINAQEFCRRTYEYYKRLSAPQK